MLCADCGTPLTACWSTSKTGDKHPYYLCPTKGCASYRKSIRRADLESEFDTMITQITPDRKTFARFARNLDALARAKRAAGETSRAELKTHIAEIDLQIETLLDRIVEGKTESLITSYERRVENSPVRSCPWTKSSTQEPRQFAHHPKSSNPRCGSSKTQ